MDRLTYIYCVVFVITPPFIANARLWHRVTFPSSFIVFSALGETNLARLLRSCS
jgi:hypothetical protein